VVIGGGWVDVVDVVDVDVAAVVSDAGDSPQAKNRSAMMAEAIARSMVLAGLRGTDPG